MSMPNRFEDFTVGWQFAGPKLHVSRAMIKEFAAASFDHNPLHWDDKFLAETEFAGGKKFDDVIGHGLMTYAIMTRAMTDWLWPDIGDHRRLETRFRKPVYPGDDIAVHGRVIEKRSTKAGNWLVCALEVGNQRGETIATGDALAEILQ